MAFSTSSSCFFTSPSFSVNQQTLSSSPSTSVKSPSSHRISANYSTSTATATAERTTTPNTLRSTRIATPSSLYEVLGIQLGADTVEIKAAYRRLARVLHPDVQNHDSSADEFMKVNSAYATLSDPRKRADYDRSLFVRSQKTVVRASSPAGFTGYTGRRWETDQCW